MKKATMMLVAALALPVGAAQAETFEQVFNQQRALHGKGHEFTWQGETYKTFHAEELEAMAEPTQANAVALIESADALRLQSAAVGYEWRDPARYIKQAQAALAEGRFQHAMDLAARAKYQARLSLAQQKQVDASWYRAVPE
ncbi:MAG: hypothetical protein GYB41_01330 [Oceanospirillales bacterium]|uniref:YfdX protein n=1 Tax=Marinobacterium halophilum TaxID=267374 RepID=A0A2P8EUQ0_9GAMM|nr:hypothetical protein [Marinobacterium halophilum]MBR9827288.1 hypothetical protein [Oceanospirillales bacterium]PSL13201.1 hypothetical protein CLV44_11330 [Marinobacterium halophilum]